MPRSSFKSWVAAAPLAGLGGIGLCRPGGLGARVQPVTQRAPPASLYRRAEGAAGLQVSCRQEGAVASRWKQGPLTALTGTETWRPQAGRPPPEGPRPCSVFQLLPKFRQEEEAGNRRGDRTAAEPAGGPWGLLVSDTRVAHLQRWAWGSSLRDEAS